MNPVQAGGLDKVFWRAFTVAFVAVSLHAVDCCAFQSGGTPGLRRLISSLLHASPTGVGLGEKNAPEGQFSFQKIDFDLGENTSDLCVGAGWFATLTPALEYFTAMGVRLSDSGSPSLLDGDEEIVQSNAFALGPWAATGVGWWPVERVRLSLEARWNAEDLPLLASDSHRSPFQAGLSLAMDW